MIRRVADYLNVHNKLDLEGSVDAERPPPLMTRQVLAKFRSMEEDSKVEARQQAPLQRQRVRIKLASIRGSYVK